MTDIKSFVFFENLIHVDLFIGIGKFLNQIFVACEIKFLSGTG